MIGLTSSGAEVVDVLWWSNGSIGIVVIRLPAVDKYKAYIGSPPTLTAGVDETSDAIWIAEHGTRMHNTAAIELFMPRFAGVDWYKG